MLATRLEGNAVFGLFNRQDTYRHTPGDPPLRVRIDITNKCNLLCKMCHYPNTVKDPKFDMEPALFQKIADQVLPYAAWASLACQYEAFMSRHVEEILRIAGDGPCKHLGIVTNATLWTERRIGLMLENPALETLVVSIDGGTKETYEDIRVNGNFDKLVRNLETFARMKREAGVERPVLRMNTVLMRRTARELPQLVDLATRVGVFRLECIRYLSINRDMDPEAITDWEEVMPFLIEAKKRAKAGGMELFLPVEDPRLDTESDTANEKARNVAEVGRFSDYCEAPWTAVQIYPNGDIHPCGFFGKSFGNLKEQDFLEIWNGEPYQKLRESLAKLRLHPKCAECNPHGYDNIERKARINKGLVLTSGAK